MDSEILIEASQLSRHYSGSKEYGQTARSNPATPHSDHIIAVDNISFTLKRGEVLGFLGPNGAGKSTTMQMLTGNLSPTHGTIKIAGLDLMDNPIETKALIGYLPDTPPLYKELTVDEYLSYCARLNRISKNKVQHAVSVSKERCGLTEHGRRVINNLSKGYQQRVGIAQAIIHSPDIVILDEPTVGLDPIQMVEIRKLIKELGETHSVMLSSHILPEVQSLCDNVQIINQGKLVFHSSINELKQHMQTHILHMSCSRPVDIHQIEALEAISKVQQNGNQLILHCSHDKNLSESILNDEVLPSAQLVSQQLITLAMQNDWGLYEIYPEKRTLEDIFMSLTCVDPTIAISMEEDANG